MENYKACKQKIVAPFKYFKKHLKIYSTIGDDKLNKAK